MQTELEQHKKEIPRVQEKCPECGSTNLVNDYEMGETVCCGCGLVLHEQMMNKGPEWRAFTQEEKLDRSRVGVPTYYSVHDKGLSTAIDRKDKDVFGRKLPLETRSQMWRLRKWNIRSRVYKSTDRNIAQAMGELDRLANKLYFIPDPVKEKAALYYRKAVKKGLSRGRSIVAVAAAALYASCRATGIPRTLKEIAEASLVDKRDVARCYRLLLRELKLQMPIANPLTYVSKIAERTGISGETQGLAIKYIHELRKKHGLRGLDGKDPLGLAAAALYTACIFRDERKTQKDIAEAAGVTEVTLRNRYRGLKEELGIELPKMYITKSSMFRP